MSSLPPRPPPGYSSIPASPAAVLLPLTISNKCGQSFRWRTVKVARTDESYDVAADHHVAVKKEEQEEPAIPLAVKAEDPDEPPPIVKGEPSNDAADLDTEYSICLADRVVLLRQDVERGYLYHRTLTASSNVAGPSSLASSTATWLHSYLSLSVPLASLYTEWSARDPIFARTAPRFQGIRMLRQDPWETLCAFICSSNNNIARIGGMVQNLCSHYSPKLLSYSYKSAEEGEDAEMTIDYHPFPSPAALAQPGVEAHLRQIGFGYRAKYIAETARMLCEEHGGVEVNDAIYDSVAAALHESAVKEDKSLPTPPPPSLSPAYTHLLSLRSLTYSEARTALLPYRGVGPKVADCILLMSLDQPASIPVDRHVFQFAAKWYGKRKNARYEELAEFFRGVWGEWAGWAHSVLFMADLRAFQDYGGVKKEESKKEEDAVVAVKKEEEVTVLAEGTERAAKRTATTVMSAATTSTKRVKGSRVDETFHGVKVSRRRVTTTTTKGSRASSVENHGEGALQAGE